MNPDNFTELQVLRSAAGYYIGRLYADEDFGGMLVPGTRESGYFATEAEALEALTNGFEVRDCMENNMLYSQGIIHRPT